MRDKIVITKVNRDTESIRIESNGSVIRLNINAHNGMVKSGFDTDGHLRYRHEFNEYMKAKADQCEQHRYE